MLETRTKLELFLQPYIDQNEGTFDYHALHGFLTGLTICPVDLSEEERNENIFDGEIALTSEDAATLNQLIAKVQTSIDRSFHEEEEGFSLSCEGELDDLDDDELVNWCTGFMAAHFGTKIHGLMVMMSKKYVNCCCRLCLVHIFLMMSKSLLKSARTLS